MGYNNPVTDLIYRKGYIVHTYETDARGLAKRAAKDFDFDQRDAQIYELRAVMTEKELASRFHLSVRRVQQIVREQLETIRQIA